MHFSRARRSRNRVFAHFRRVLPRFADFQRVFRGFFDFFTDFRDFRHVPEAIRAVFSFRASKLTLEIPDFGTLFRVPMRPVVSQILTS